MNENSTYKVDVSVVIPVYNSAATLSLLCARIRETLLAARRSFELVLVDDGSTDDSWEVMELLKAEQGDGLTAIKLGRNFGQHNATLCGIRYASGRLIVTIDDDLQCLPEEIPALITVWEDLDCDLVYGIYAKKKHSFFRNLGSKLLKKLFRYLVNGVRDGSSFRLITGELAEKVQGYDQHFVFIDQVLSWYTLDIGYAEVEHEKREVGKSGYSSLKLFRMAINIIFSYTDLPLRIMTWTGFIASILSLGIGTYFILQKLSIGAAVGFTALIVSIFFSTSIILLSLGILGEYIGRIYAARGDRPNYSIKKKL